MQSKKIILSLSCLGAAALTATGAHPVCADPFLPVPPASFLNYHVDTVDQLSQQVAFDGVVRARLARHFHRTEPDVTRYIHDNLVLIHLTHGAQFRVACVTPSGRDYSISEYLKAGTGVFALKTTRQPILKQACGNPLVAQLPVIPEKLAPPQLAKAPTATPTAVPVTDELPSDVTFTAVPPLASPEMVGVGPFVRVAGVTESLGHGGFGFLPILAGVAGVGLFSGHHGSSPPSVTPKPPVTPPVIPPITPPVVKPPFVGPPPTKPPSQSSVPEPGPVATYGAGCLVLSLMMLRARRRMQNS